jgi:hypothetical protein
MVTTDRADAEEEREDATIDETDAATNLRDAEEVAAHYDDIRTELRRHEDLLDNPVYHRPSAVGLPRAHCRRRLCATIGCTGQHLGLCTFC